MRGKIDPVGRLLISDVVIVIHPTGSKNLLIEI